MIDQAQENHEPDSMPFCEGEDLDEEFRTGDCVEVEMGSEPPTDDDDDANLVDDDDDDDGGDVGVFPAPSMGDEEDEFAGVDDAAAHAAHKESVLSVAVCPVRPELVCTGGQDDVAVLWELQREASGLTYREFRRLEGHTDSVIQVAFSNDGQYVATASYDATVKIWQATSGELVHSLEGPSSEVEWCLWHPKGHAILAGSLDTMAWMWWAPTGKMMQIFAGHAAAVSCGCWPLGGKLIATGSEDHGVIVWNPRGGSPQQHFRDLFDGGVLSICAHAESPIVVAGSENAVVAVLQIETGAVLHRIGGHTDSVEAVAFNQPAPGGLLLLASAGMEGKVQIFDGKTFDLRVTLAEHVDKGGVIRFKWLPASPLGPLLLTCSTDRTLRLFSALDGRCLRTLRGHSQQVMDLDLALGPIEGPDGAQQLCVLSASDDATTRVFMVPLGGASGGAAAAPAPEAADAPLKVVVEPHTLL